MAGPYRNQPFVTESGDQVWLITSAADGSVVSVVPVSNPRRSGSVPSSSRGQRLQYLTKYRTKSSRWRQGRRTKASGRSGGTSRRDPTRRHSFGGRASNRQQSNRSHKGWSQGSRRRRRRRRSGKYWSYKRKRWLKSKF